MKIVLIRHGATAGNIKKRYIGITDEDLCASGIESIHNNIKAGYYQEVQAVYVSPMKRCRQTAKLIYPEYKQHIVPDFRECDFGIFENKNYKELSGNGDYQAWIDSNGTLPFPNGESMDAFKSRCLEACPGQSRNGSLPGRPGYSGQELWCMAAPLWQSWNNTAIQRLLILTIR